MPEAPRQPALTPLLEACCRSLQDSLHALINRKIEVTPGTWSATTVEGLAAQWRSNVVVVRGSLDKDFAGKTLSFVCAAGEACTLAGTMMMVADEVVTQRRAAGVLGGDDLSAFAEVASVVCVAIESALRERLGDQVGLRKLDHTTLAPGGDYAAALGTEPLVAMTMTIVVDKFPPSTAHLLIDRTTAERWNGAAVASNVVASKNRTPAPNPPEAEDDDTPAAPIRGRLAAFLVDIVTAPALRRTCRRVGLEFDKRPRGDVPNPAALKDAVVFIEIAPTEERRFEWCRRIKTLRPQTKVVLLLVVPSRPHVLQAARVGADVVLGHPVSAQLLTQKLNTLLEPAPEEVRPKGSA